MDRIGPESTESPTQPPTLRERFRRVNPRVRGLTYLALGLYFAKVDIWDQLHAAQMHSQSVLLIGLLVFFGVVFPPLGVAYLAFGDQVDQYFDAHRIDRNNLKPRDIVTLLLMAAPVCVLWVVITQRLLAQGYH